MEQNMNEDHNPKLYNEPLITFKFLQLHMAILTVSLSKNVLMCLWSMKFGASTVAQH